MVKCAIAINRWKDRRTDLKDGHVSIHHNITISSQYIL